MKEIIEREGDVPVEGTPAAAIFATSAGNDDDDTPLTRAAYTAIRREESETRGMKGATPKAFSGDRKDSERFLEEFDIFREVNRENKTIKEPYSRVLIALSYLKGDKIKNWRHMQLAAIRKYVAEGGDPNDEYIWRRFEKDFRSAYTNTTEKQDAYVKMKDLRMTGGDLDQYISDHENLAFLAEWPEEDHGAIESFIEGLSPGLRLAILKRDDVPETYEEWKRAAKKEHAKWALIKSSGLLRGGKTTGRQDRWKAALTGKGGSQAKTKDPDAMDVDNVRLNKLTDEERRKLMTEGRCFRCRKQGHLSKQCPNPGGRGSETKVNAAEAKIKPKECAPEVVDDREDPSDVESEATAVTERSKKRSTSGTARVNTTKMLPRDFVKALEALDDEE